VLDGDPAPSSPKKGAPQFSAHVCCGQTAGWINMAFGMEVGLDPGHIVLDGDQSPPPPKKGAPPIFGSYLLWPNGWIDQDTTWYGGRPRPRPHCVRWGLSSTHVKRGTASPNCRPICVVAKRLDGSRCHLLRRYIGLGPGHTVLHEDPAPSHNGHSPQL